MTPAIIAIYKWRMGNGMDLLSIGLGVFGALTGAVGLVYGWLGWKKSGQALTEAQWTPVRQAQHSLMAKITALAEDLSVFLPEQLNYRLQAMDPTELTGAADHLRTIVDGMTSTVVVDKYLDERLRMLREEVLLGDVDRSGFADSVEEFGRLIGEIEGAKSATSTAQGAEKLFALGGRYAQTKEPLRVRNSSVIGIIDEVRARLDQIAREGLGDLPSSRG